MEELKIWDPSLESCLTVCEMVHIYKTCGCMPLRWLETPLPFYFHDMTPSDLGICSLNASLEADVCADQEETHVFESLSELCSMCKPLCMEQSYEVRPQT